MTILNDALRRFCVMAAGLLCAGGADAVPQYQYFDLGPGRQTYRVGVDDGGRAAWSDRDRGAKQVRMWQGGHVTDMPHPEGIGASSFLGISTAGVIGTWAGATRWESFIWNGGQSFALEPGADTETSPIPAQARSINNSGQVAGSAYRMIEEIRPVQQAAMWDGVGQHVLLENDRMDLVSKAMAINDLGHSVGTRTIAPHKEVVSIWDNTGLMHESITTPSSWVDVEPRAINANDTIVANMRMHSDSLFTVAAKWDGDSWSVLPRVGGHSVAEAINDEGTIVGHTNYLRATVWHENARYDLNTLVQAAGQASLLRAYDVNESGWIVGTSYDPSRSISERVFLAVPIVPLPSTGTISVLLLGGALQRRRRPT